MSLTEKTSEDNSLFSLDEIISEYQANSDNHALKTPKPVRERGSALPTEEEIRAYLSAYARGESDPSFQSGKRASDDTQVFDPRFRMAADRDEQRRARYGGREIDTSAEWDYQPPHAVHSVSTHVPEPEEEQPSSADEKPGVFRRMKDGMERRRVERDRQESERREAAARIVPPVPEDLILPGETRTERRPRGAHTAVPVSETADTLAEASRPAQRRTGESHVTPSWSRQSTSHREYASVFPDTSASPAIYAAPQPEADEPLAGDGEMPRKPDKFFPANFREYLSSLFTTAFYGLRKSAVTILTAEEDDEELGSEATPAFASRYYARSIRSLRLRLRVCGALLLVLAWLSLGLPVTGQLANIRVAALLCLCIQCTIMLLCQDVLTGGILNAFRKRLGADSLAVIACVASSLDALLVGLGVMTAAHMPLCFISSLSLVGVLLSALLSCRALRKSLRVPSIAARSYSVTGEMDMENRGTTILKSLRPYTGFVRRSEEAPPDETLFQKLSLPLLLLCALLTLLTVILTRNVRDFFYILSVLLCAAVPFASLLCFALPFFNGTHRIFPSGAAIAGWSGLCDVGQSKNIIVTDRDLFPDGTVEIEQVRIFADARADRIISYAGSMLAACGSSVSGCFADLMERHNCAMRQIENFEYLPGGGMKGVIDSSVILCGSSELMQLMNVRIPYRLVGQGSILLAVDGILYGIFNVKYHADERVRKALLELMRSNRHPIFAIRDFNVSPSMLRECFKVATDGYDFPPYVDRFPISSAAPGEDSKVAAVVCRDGLGPLSNMASVGRNMYVAVKTSLRWTALSAFIGVVLSFLRMVSHGGVSVAYLFVFMLLCALPVLFFGTFLNFE